MGFCVFALEGGEEVGSLGAEVFDGWRVAFWEFWSWVLVYGLGRGRVGIGDSLQCRETKSRGKPVL